MSAWSVYLRTERGKATEVFVDKHYERIAGPWLMPRWGESGPERSAALSE
jgi:hypothetical protein